MTEPGVPGRQGHSHASQIPLILAPRRSRESEEPSASPSHQVRTLDRGTRGHAPSLTPGGQSRDESAEPSFAEPSSTVTSPARPYASKLTDPVGHGGQRWSKGRQGDGQGWARPSTAPGPQTRRFQALARPPRRRRQQEGRSHCRFDAGRGNAEDGPDPSLLPETLDPQRAQCEPARPRLDCKGHRGGQGTGEARAQRRSLKFTASRRETSGPPPS